MQIEIHIKPLQQLIIFELEFEMAGVESGSTIVIVSLGQVSRTMKSTCNYERQADNHVVPL